MGIDHITTRTGSAVFQLLLATHPTLLSREEIGREIGDSSGVDDALRRFAGLGLVHELGGFVWPTRTAIAAEEASSAHLLDEAPDRGE
jgi:hypothetical protein